MKKKKQYAVKAQKKTKICIVYQNNAEEGDSVWPDQGPQSMSQKNDHVKILHRVVEFFVENLEDWGKKIGICIFFLQYC